MKLTKVLFTTGIALPSLVVPMSTLTSCAQSWGNKTPFMIGSITQGPYWLEETEEKLYDKDGKEIINYIQNQYAVQTKTSQYYAYSTPFVFNDKGTEKGEWTQTGESGWYQSGDEAFVMSATDKEGDKSKDSKSCANATLSPNIDFVASIGSSVNNFIDYALQYQGQQVNTDDETNLNIAWGGGEKVGSKKFKLNHGDKSGSTKELKDQNDQFFEYIFAHSNLNGKEKSQAMLKTSQVNFTFETFPLPAYDIDNFISDTTGALLDGDAYTNENVYATGDPTALEEKDEDGNVHKYNVYTYDAVPVMINFENITQTYLNPSIKDDSFLVNDYYSSTKQIKDSIGDQWKKMLPKLTSEGFNCTPNFRSFKISVGQKMINTESINVDERLPIDGDTYEINGSSFIALIGYTVKENNDDTPDHTKDVVSITGLQNLFPTYFIDLYGNELFKVNKTGSDGKDYYVVNQDKVNDKITKLLELLRRTGKQGYETDLTKLDEDSQKLLSFLGYMFGDNSNNINTNQFLTCQEPINS